MLSESLAHGDDHQALVVVYVVLAPPVVKQLSEVDPLGANVLRLKSDRTSFFCNKRNQLLALTLTVSSGQSGGETINFFLPDDGFASIDSGLYARLIHQFRMISDR